MAINMLWRNGFGYIYFETPTSGDEKSGLVPSSFDTLNLTCNMQTDSHEQFHSVTVRLNVKNLPGLLYPCACTAQVNLQIVRHRKSKHWNPKFKKLRALKYIKVELPNFNPDESSKNLTEDEMRAKLKEKGILPPRPWMERSFYISCTRGVMDPYVPPEGDGKISAVTLPGAKQKFDWLQKKGKSMSAVRKIRNFDEDFEPVDFVNEAQEIYVNAHSFFVHKDKYKLREYVTEHAYPGMMTNVKDKTIHWKFLQSLEPARVVHVRTGDMITKDNIFAQITVRFHTQQVLAVYDRFGRLMHGSEILAKDVLEYIVFEKHLSNQYGKWRVHEKIIPDWMPPKEPLMRTYVKENVDSADTSAIDTSVEVTEREEKPTGTVPVPA